MHFGSLTSALPVGRSRRTSTSVAGPSSKGPGEFGPGHRGLIIASVVAAAALTVGAAMVVLLVANRGSTTVNGAYGAISCSAPNLPGATVSVRVTDAGDAMMDQAPMMATLRATLPIVPAGRVSFVVSNSGA